LKVTKINISKNVFYAAVAPGATVATNSLDFNPDRMDNIFWRNTSGNSNGVAYERRTNSPRWRFDKAI
jgi:hypothetical protein